MFLKTNTYVPTVLQWAPLAVVILSFFGAGYMATEYVIRSSAYDPQIQIAEDFARALASGEDVKKLVPDAQVDIANSLASFIVTYGDDFKPTKSSGNHDAQIPTPNKSVFDSAKTNSQHSMEWEAYDNINVAIVMRRYEGAQSGYVMVGRNIREINRRVSELQNYWLVGVLTALVGSFGFYGYNNRKKPTIHNAVHMGA